MRIALAIGQLITPLHNKKPHRLGERSWLYYHLLLRNKYDTILGRLLPSCISFEVIFLSRMRKTHAAAIIVAAGEARRMGADKQMLELAGVPVLLHTLKAFEVSPLISEIIVVTRTDTLELVAGLAKTAGITKLTKVMAGGETRTESVQNGLYAVSHRAKLVAIHDGARPLVSQKIILDAVNKAVKYNAAAPAVPVKSTIKQVQRGYVVSTPERSELYEVQTPQVFDVDLIKGAIAAATKSGKQYTDDCAAVEAIGATVYITKGAYENMKLTTPEDLIIAEMFLLSASTEDNALS